MKKSILLTIAAVLCSVMTIFAQTNNKISYQAVVRDANNNLVANTPLTVQVTLTDANNNAYSERHSVTSNTNGLISLTLGNGTDVSGNWDDIQWNKATVTTKIYRFSDGEQLGTVTMPLMAVPYALYADSASLADHAMAADSVNETWLTNYLTTHNINGGGSGSFTQENADWNATSGVTEILNKPSIRDSVSRTLIDSLADENSNISQLANSFANNYLTTNHFLTKDSSVITNLQAGIQKAALCDSVEGCVSGMISDSLSKYATKDYVNEHGGSSINPNDYATKDDLNTLNDRVNIFNTNVCDSIATCVHDTANAIRRSLRDSVNIIVVDSLADPNSEMNYAVDTIAEKATLRALYEFMSHRFPLERVYRDTIKVNQSAIDTVFELPDYERVVPYFNVAKIFINGVLVGDSGNSDSNNNSVITLHYSSNNDTSTITYHSDKNHDGTTDFYKLKEGDIVVIYYYAIEVFPATR